MLATETLGQRLRRLRSDKKLTQTDLSAKSGVSYAAISRIENDRYENTPHKSTLVALAYALEIDPTELVNP